MAVNGSSSPSIVLARACVAPNLQNTLVIPSVYIFDLHIDPADERSLDDVYIIFNEDGTEHQRRSVRDDAVPGDDKVTLVFTGMRKGLRYSLMIDEGLEGEYYAFYRILLQDLVEADTDPDLVAGKHGNKPIPASYEELGVDDDIPELPDRFADRPSSGGWNISQQSLREAADDDLL
jgi:hypothetical protein